MTSTTEDTVKPMSGAELKTRLDGLGLPPSWFGDRMGVTMRTVVRWFDGPDVSPEVREEIERLSAMAIEQMTEMLTDVGDLEAGAPVTLYTFRTDKEYGDHGWPASWHRHLTFRLTEHFESQGHVVAVEYA